LYGIGGGATELYAELYTTRCICPPFAHICPKLPKIAQNCPERPAERKFKPENAAKIQLIAAKLTQNSAEAPSSVELAAKLPLNSAKAPKTGARRFIFQKMSKKCRN